jgi:PAS domain-containing protein
MQSRGCVLSKNTQDQSHLVTGYSVNIQVRKIAQLALLETRNRLQNIFNHNSDIMMISRMADGCIIDVNDAFVRASGYSRAEAISNTSAGLNLWSK